MATFSPPAHYSQFQDPPTSPVNAIKVYWDIRGHNQLTMDTTIAALTTEYCDSWEHIGILCMPDVNVAYLFNHPISVRNCTSTITSMD